MKLLIDWLDDRTGIRNLMHEALYERIPGGARWRYVWGSTLCFTFSIQVITGFFLWMCYSPNTRSAWESVYYIQYKMQGGWLLRGIHHFTAQAMIVLLALHLLQVVIDGAYRAPREVNFWLGILLMKVVLGLSLTGYLLPWDQKGFWATNVATNLMSLVPGVGSELQRMVVGGPSYGHATLTRFFALHAGVLPAALVFLLVLHIAVFRRHGICAVGASERPATTFWPDQVLKDAVACLAVLAVILLFIAKGYFLSEHQPGVPVEAHLGAELGAPADAAVPYSAARPEWYFLFLFQFLKYFHGNLEIFGAIVIPGFVMFLLAIMPLVGRWRLGHGFNVALLVALGIGIAVLTGLALREDAASPEYQNAIKVAEENRLRAVQLAQSPTGIPEAGATFLMREDPKTAGSILFNRHCASCHTHLPGGSPSVMTVSRWIDTTDQSAPNLAGFGTRSWIHRVLDPQAIASTEQFGKTAHGAKDDKGGYKEGGMVQFTLDDLANLSESDKKLLADVVAALSAEAKLSGQRTQDEQASRDGTLESGKKAISEKFGCTDCHKFHDLGDLGTAPDLTGYGSREWLIAFISNPAHERFYADRNDRMPAYAKDSENPHNNVLRLREIEIIVDWLRGEWYEPM